MVAFLVFFLLKAIDSLVQVLPYDSKIAWRLRKLLPVFNSRQTGIAWMQYNLLTPVPQPPSFTLCCAKLIFVSVLRN